MNNIIKAFREEMELTQKEFAMKYNIPIRTLQRWEQGQSKPNKYILDVIQKENSLNNDYKKISNQKNTYYYSYKDNQVMDNKGTTLKITVDISKAIEKNLVLYFEDLFKEYYTMMDILEQKCKNDEKYGIVWTRLE